MTPGPTLRELGPGGPVVQDSPAVPPLVVAIPACNEQGRIGQAVASLGTQLGETGASLSAVVLANNCSDDTAGEARRAAEALPFSVQVVEETYPPGEAHVGRARGRVLQLAADVLGAHPHGLLASTDADTVLAPDWALQLRLALRDADVVGGRILTLPDERRTLPAALRRLQLQDAAYHLLSAQLTSRLDPDPHDPWPRHHQHFGANLGLRRSAWDRLDAWPQVRCLEDLALVRAFQRLDLRLRHCPQVRVWTSARAHGRVDTGLSSQLREWHDLQQRGEAWTVPGAEELRAAAVAGAALRAAWQQGQAGADLEALWMVGAGALDPAVRAATLGLARELAQHVQQDAGHWRRRYPPVPVQEAVRSLRALLD